MQNNRFELVIVIPCYNEAKRFKLSAFESFLDSHPKVGIVFVDDGSTDTTSKLLGSFKTLFKSQVELISRSQNHGKAFSVKEGIGFLVNNGNTNKIAYIDADLAVSLEECVAISHQMTDKIKCVFGSRINTVDNQINRKTYRFLIGRFVAYIISKMLQISIYDTQCGCKIFTSDIAALTFKKPFISKWLFDVEIFFRLIVAFGRKETITIIKEIPVKKWVDTPDSRVSLTYAFKLWIDLIKIQRTYEKQLKNARIE